MQQNSIIHLHGLSNAIAAPEALDIDSEPEHIRKLYGVDEKRCEHFARQCLIARHLMGVDHKRLTFNFNGRDFRLTDVAGRVIQEVIA